MPSPKPRSSRLMYIALVGSAALVAIALAAFWFASDQAKHAPPKATDNTVRVVIKDKACEPNDITVPAGRTHFTIVNQSNRAPDWEILNGVVGVERWEEGRGG